MRPGMVSRACVQPLVSADHACHVNQLIVHEGQIKSVARVLSSCGTLSHAGCYAACQVARHYHRCVIVRGPTQIRDGASGEGTPLLQSHPDPIASHRITFLMAAVGAGCRQFQTCCLYLLRYPPAPARPARHSLTTPSLPPPPKPLSTAFQGWPCVPKQNACPPPPPPVRTDVSVTRDTDRHPHHCIVIQPARRHWSLRDLLGTA